jgi:glycosyltransferase involved in cell wall biosynthesis
MKTLVSVGNVAFSSGGYIADTRKNVIARDLSDAEVIVVDEEPKDNTADIVAQFPSVYYVYKSNGDQASARNDGIRMA